jgi:hypothetical protein
MCGEGSFEDWEECFAWSNLEVYSRRAVSLREQTASIIVVTIGIIWAVFWIGRDRRPVLSAREMAEEL